MTQVESLATARAVLRRLADELRGSEGQPSEETELLIASTTAILGLLAAMQRAAEANPAEMTAYAVATMPAEE